MSGAQAAARPQMPGRTCPADYRYPPRVFDRPAQLTAGTLYVVGGLYGNVEALEAVLRLAGDDEAGTRIVFNGDFHWFDADAGDFAHVNREVLRHGALRGNVETELSRDDLDAGCGCAYPSDVSDAEVRRSNEILERLRVTARVDPAMRNALGALPMHLTAQVGAARVGVVHGDATSLAGWGFALERLGNPGHERWLQSVFRESGMQLFACTHTCLPALAKFSFGAVANNGAAGMPNFAGTQFGLATRISTKPARKSLSAGGFKLGDVHVDAVRIDYDAARWLDRFLASWPDGTPAHASYHRRIVHGPRFEASRGAVLAA